MWNTTIHRFWDPILRGLSDMWYRGTLIPMFVLAGTDAEQGPEMSFLRGCALPRCLESLYPLTQIARGDAVPAQVEEELRLFLGDAHPEEHIVHSWTRMAALWEVVRLPLRHGNSCLLVLYTVGGREQETPAATRSL